MAHEITQSDKMAYRLLNGDPWHISETRDRSHGFGGEISGADIQKMTALDYSLSKVRLRPVESDEEVEDIFGIRREDTGKCLPGVAVGKNYTILQPSRLFEWGDAIRGCDPGAQWETAGSLFGGKRVWGLIKLGGEIIIDRGRHGEDKSFAYALISTTFDATQATVVQHTNWRVVCNNTLSAAIGENGNQFWIRHTKTQEEKLLQATQAMGHAIEWHTAFAETAQRLAEEKMTEKDAAFFFAMLQTGKDDPGEAAKVVADAAGKRATHLKDSGGLLLHLFKHGKGNFGETKLDALNGTTEFIDRERARIRKFRGSTAGQMLDSALDSSQFGNGAKAKQRALNLLTR